MSVRYFDHLRSQCMSVELVNVELTDTRALCGWAYVEAWAQDSVTFRDEKTGQVLCILTVPTQFQGHPSAIAVSSPEDNLFFAVKKDGQTS